MMNYFKSVFLILVLLSTSSYAYVLRNEFYILNLCKSTVEINYNTCFYKQTDGISSVSCEDDILILRPNEAKKFSVDSNDNYLKDAKNGFYREVYVYQVMSRNALGLFSRDKVDIARFEDDYKNEPVKGVVHLCSAAKEHSVILNDHGTDTIYCDNEAN
ncbi:MAG: hypothetical protein M1486_01135 [Gammaproteobacteria bacterium]|nr:hypothetical protein [Gammaproteobacteria bacterium]